MKDWRLHLRQNQGLLIAIGLFLLFYGIYSSLHPQGLTPALFNQNSNECFVLVMAAMAQTIPVLTGGLDLSIGAIITLVNCLASEVLGGTAVENALGIAACLVAGLLCGFCNGCLVVYGRLQPIIATLASSAIFIGIALFIRPTPGGTIDSGNGAGQIHLRHHPAAEHVAIGVGILRHGENTQSRIAARRLAGLRHGAVLLIAQLSSLPRVTGKIIQG